MSMNSHVNDSVRKSTSDIACYFTGLTTLSLKLSFYNYL